MRHAKRSRIVCNRYIFCYLTFPGIIAMYKLEISLIGVKLAANSNRFAFSTSTDQRLNVWEINVNHPQGVSLTLADATFVDVPDPSVMDVVGFK